MTRMGAQKKSSNTVALFPRVDTMLEGILVRRGLSKTDAASAGIWLLCRMSAEARDRVMEGYTQWRELMQGRGEDEPASVDDVNRAVEAALAEARLDRLGASPDKGAGSGSRAKSA